MGISLLVIAHNERDRIAGCLSSTRPYVDEVVLVDQGSTDDTVSVALPWVDVLFRDVCRGLSEWSLPCALRYVCHDWVLRLDADEVCSKLFLERLQSLCCADVDGFWLWRRNWIDGVRCVRSEDPEDWQMRLFRKDGVWFGGGVHEHAHITGSEARVGYPCILHRKSRAEQNLDDAGYARLALSAGRPGEAGVGPGDAPPLGPTTPKGGG